MALRAAVFRWGLRLEGRGRSSEEEEDVEGPGESIMGDGVCLCLGGVTQQCAGESLVPELQRASVA